MNKAAIPLEQLRARYDALGPLPEFPGEREWVDRLRTFDDFVEFGPLTWDTFVGISKREHERMRTMAPELYELLRQAFSTVTPPRGTG